jgi:hypothetical protein
MGSLIGEIYAQQRESIVKSRIRLYLWAACSKTHNPIYLDSPGLGWSVSITFTIPLSGGHVSESWNAIHPRVEDWVQDGRNLQTPSSCASLIK